MLFKSATLKQIRDGQIDLAFRRWKRPTVKSGGTLNTPIGQLTITLLTEVKVSDISKADLRRAGYSNLTDLSSQLKPDGTLYRIEFKILGADPRLQLREQPIKSENEFEELHAKLIRMDKRSPIKWTRAVLFLIEQFPESPAVRLAERIEIPKMELKTKVRRLKNLGLTISHSVGYSLSPRGVSYLKWTSND